MTYRYIRFRVHKSKTAMTVEFVYSMSLAVEGLRSSCQFVFVPLVPRREQQSTKVKIETRRREGEARSMALHREESKQNEAMKIRAALENPQTFGLPLRSAMEERHARFRLKGEPGGCRWGLSYGDFDWPNLIRDVGNGLALRGEVERSRTEGGSPADQAP